MDYIREFDIRLDKEHYYAGETINGLVILDTVENFKLRSVRVVLRGKAHAEWKVVLSGDRRTVKDDQYFVDERQVIWGEKNLESTVPILPRGHHTFSFRFSLPESALPCSFESRPCTVRYYIKVTVDIPYASPPQGMKYFTVVGPHIDCMDEQYLKPLAAVERSSRCSPACCCGPLLAGQEVTLRCTLERTAYVCNESLRLKATIDNGGGRQAVRLVVRLVQYCEYFIERGVLGLSKDAQHPVLEYRGAPVKAGERAKWDSAGSLVLPVMPTTLVGVCRLLQVYYVLKVSLESCERQHEQHHQQQQLVHLHFPITVATVPFRIPNASEGERPHVRYETAAPHVEGGLYIGPEFLLGQVYDGLTVPEGAQPVVLYRPVYVCVTRESHQPQETAGLEGQQHH